MPSGIANVLAELALAEDRITCDNRALEWQALQQSERGCDLVLVRFDDEVADHGGKLGGEGGQDMQGLGIVTAAAPERFAVNGDVARRGIAEHEFAEHRLKRAGVE
jgi:hypothetical protein